MKGESGLSHLRHTTDSRERTKNTLPNSCVCDVIKGRPLCCVSREV